MSIKIFGKGLGQADRLDSTSSPVDVPQTSDTAQITRNTALFATGQGVNPNGDPTVLRTTFQAAGGSPAINVDLRLKPQVFSGVSGQVPFETLFSDFDLQIFPFYNFWTPDELTNDRDERGDRQLSDIPRFIKVSWLVAPDLPDPAAALPKRVNRRTIKPILFSQELQRPNVFRAKGIDFSPAHLQPDGMEKIKPIIANGYMAPGVIEAVVDMPLANAGATPPVDVNQVDEDVFLNDPSTRGVSVHELRAQQLQLTNGTFQSGMVGRDGISSGLQAQKDGLVDGKFSITKAPAAGGTMSIQSVHAASPSISIISKTATPSRQDSPDPASDTLSKVSQPTSFNDNPTSAQTKVKFYNPAIGGLVSASKVQLMSAPEHLEAMSSLAPVLPSLELLSRTNYYSLPRKMDIPSLPAPRTRPKEYIGYVLEKYRRGKNGIFVKVEEIDFPSREVNEYYDTKVLYGETYRYRIRAILRWTRPSNVGIAGRDKTVIPKFGSHTQAVASHLSSYFYGEWSARWAYGTCMDDQPPLPPDELQVRAESQRKRVVVTFRLPENSQRDILSMRLFRKLVDESGRDLTDWVPLVHSDSQVDQPPRNVIYFDTNVDFYQVSKMRYVYAAQCISRHGEDSVLSVQLSARLNKDYSSRGEFPTEEVSSAGVRMEYFGAFSKIPFEVSKSELIVPVPAQHVGEAPGVAAVVFTGRDAVGNAMRVESNYVIRIQSLDTGQTEDIPFDVIFKAFKDREKFYSKHIFAVPAEPEKKSSVGFQSKTPNVIQKALAPYLDPKRLSVQKVAVQPKDMAQPGDRWKR